MESQLIVDADRHQTYSHHREVAHYMSGPFRARCLESGFGYPGGMYYSSVGGVRRDAFPENGVAGSSYELMKEQLTTVHTLAPSYAKDR